MRFHVFCVWDFQSLLKALQRVLTCVEVPWLPTADGEARRLINEIVLEEESDRDERGHHRSHFEVYREAMERAGADGRPVDALIACLRAGETVEHALRHAPAAAAAFVKTTLRVAMSGDVHRVIGVFTHSREDRIPAMFTRLVAELASGSDRWDTFLWYLQRHIESDGERHGPISHKLLERVCGDDPRKWAEAEESAREALEARLQLWDAIAVEIEAIANTA